MSKKEKVTFLGEAESRDHKGKVEMQAKRGDVKELHPASAAHWINRGMAVEGAVNLDEGPEEPTELEKAAAALEKSNQRLKAANENSGNVKELDLAKKHQAKKQQEYDALAASDKA